MANPGNIVLASRSPYRAELLGRLLPDFEQQAADIDESPHARENPADYVSRLSRAKARTVAERLQDPQSLIIGSDQAAVLGGQILGKPESMERGIAMLTACAGKEVHFMTGLCLMGGDGTVIEEHLDQTRVRFRPFESATARAYLEKEPALDCAGSFRCEGLGISLFEAIESEDPTALIGLPLIALARALRAAGADPLNLGE